MGAILGMVGTGVSMAGGMKAGAEAAYLGQQQAKWKERDADIALQNSKYAAYMHMRNAGKMVGQQRAAYAASGVTVDVGSPLAVMDETNRVADAEHYNILREGQLQSDALRGDAQLMRMGAQNIQTGATLSAVGQGLSSFSSLGGSKGVSTGTGKPAPVGVPLGDGSAHSNIA